MTPAETLVDLLGGETAEPVLSEDSIADCLLKAAVPNADGDYEPTDPHWESYDYHRAAAAGWRRKAAIVAADYSMTIEGRELNRAQMIDNFLKMANEESALAQPRYFAAPDSTDSWRV
jgi:hypothetical protein